jgi:hypothetical protein
MDYVVTTLIVIVLLAIGLGILIVRHENEPGTRPSLRAARMRVNPRLRRSGTVVAEPVVQAPPEDFPAEP